MAKWIKVSEHPSNNDASATLVSGGRESLSIFHVRGGFVAALNGFALEGLFATQQAARDAIAQAELIAA